MFASIMANPCHSDVFMYPMNLGVQFLLDISYAAMEVRSAMSTAFLVLTNSIPYGPYADPIDNLPMPVGPGFFPFSFIVEMPMRTLSH